MMLLWLCLNCAVFFSLAAAHLVYYELQGDIFGNMYAGEDAFSGMTLSRLLQAFPNVRLHDDS